MQVRIAQDAPASVRTGALVVPVFTERELERGCKSRRRGARRRDRRRARIRRDQRKARRVRAGARQGSAVSPRARSSAWANATSSKPTHLARYAGAAVRYLGSRNVAAIALRAARRSQRQRNSLRVICRRRRDQRHLRDDDLPREARQTRSATESVTILANGFDRRRARSGRRARHDPGRSGELRAPPGAHAGQRHDADAFSPTRRTKGAQEAGLEIDVLDEDAHS